MTFNPKDLGRIRMQLRLYPSPGVHLSAREASMYSVSHRYLDAFEMALRMQEVNILFKIFASKKGNNSIENWLKNIRGLRERFARGEKEIQHGIFFIREDRQFPGGFGVFANIGTILDGSLYETQGDNSSESRC